jgi:hypothetical protein
MNHWWGCRGVWNVADISGVECGGSIDCGMWRKYRLWNVVEVSGVEWCGSIGCGMWQKYGGGMWRKYPIAGEINKWF